MELPRGERQSYLHPLFNLAVHRLQLQFYQHSGDTPSRYAAPTTLALSLLVTDRPAAVPERCRVRYR